MNVPPDSPGGPEPPHKSDDEGGEEGGTLFQIRPGNGRNASASGGAAEQSELQQQYYPPPLGAIPPVAPQQTHAGGGGGLHIPNPAGINRLDSSASTSTTRASRGSPPPPETPATDTLPSNGLTGIEARYAASGIPGSNTLTEMQAQSAAAAARRAQYASPQPQRGTPPIGPQAAQAATAAAGGRWSPTERPGSAPHGPPITFQGNEEVQATGTNVPQGRQGSYPNQQLEQDMSRMNIHDEPPPAYSPPAAGTANSQYPNEKGRYAAANATPQQSQSPAPGGSAAGAGAAGNKLANADPNLGQHPAFANDARQAMTSPQPSQQNGAPHGMTPVNIAQANQASPQPSGAGPSSPPPLPEGWIAHLDNNSGQYYYIHLPTQSTQWEFPKGPNPLNLQDTPMSPIGVGAPGVRQPERAPIPRDVDVQATDREPRVPRPAERELQRPPQHGEHCVADGERGFHRSAAQRGRGYVQSRADERRLFRPVLAVHEYGSRARVVAGERDVGFGCCAAAYDPCPSECGFEPESATVEGASDPSHQRWIFYRYDLDLRMEDAASAKWTYAITSHLGCTRYEFLVAGRYENSWRFVAHSGNDFAMNVSANERGKLGGIPVMWKDVLLKHQECGGFHAQIGLGGQIYGDRLWKDIPALKQWTQTSGKENRKNAPWSPRLEEDVSHAYFHFYTSHFDPAGDSGGVRAGAAHLLSG